jgi:RimJ/RimL family protein N-acetyltransferase
MWERCSLATRIARFHAPVRDIPASYLETVLSAPDTSLVAVHGSAGAVIASLIPGRGGSAELGVLVEDTWQRQGIGREVVAQLIASAHQVTELTASVLAQNAAVVGLLRRVPGEFSLTRDGTTVHVRVRLTSAGPRPGRDAR